MRTLRHGFFNGARRVALAFVVATAAAAGVLSAGCETDDSSTPLPPAVKDATTDTAPDGAGSGPDAAPMLEASTPETGGGTEGGVTDAPAESSGD